MCNQTHSGWMGLMALLIVSSASPSGATTTVNGIEYLNLTNTTIIASSPSATIAPDTMEVDLDGESTTISAGFLNGALFRQGLPTDPVNSSGSGNFRDLYNIQNNGVESGYNRNGAGNASVPGGFNPYIRVGDLIPDASGLYYVFALDINEPDNGKDNWLVLDELRLYVGGTTDPSPLPSVANVDSLGSLVWDLDGGGTQRHVLLDYAAGSSGSGRMDLWVFIPVSSFAGYSSDQYVYLYSSFGNLGFTDSVSNRNWGGNAGAEQWALATTSTPVDLVVPPEPVVPSSLPEDPVIPVPEPTTAASVTVGLLTLAALRRRRSTR
jgi:PEP-CTERM putative exosortase interaction domain